MSKSTNPVTEVIFRKFSKKEGGQILALFPYDTERRYGTCDSYMHIGQHGTADLGIIANTKLATPAEYADLKSELENYGPAEANYNLKVIKKVSWSKYRKVHDKQNERFKK